MSSCENRAVTLDALMIVVGWPYLGSVVQAGPARVLLRYERGAAGIDLATGERTGEVPIAVPGPTFLALRDSRLAEHQDATASSRGGAARSCAGCARSR